MTIESSSPAEMVQHDTLRPEAETSAQTPKAKKRTAKSKSVKPRKGSKARGSAARSAGKTSKRGKKKTPPKKRATNRSKTKGVRTRTRSGKKGPRGGKPGNGTRRKNKSGTAYHIMSVHVPLPILAKLDRRVSALAKAGKPGASRSAFALLAIQSRI